MRARINIICAGLITVCLLGTPGDSECKPQAVVWVPVDDLVYEFLDILAGKGIIPLKSITSKPLSRADIGRLLMISTRSFDRIGDRVFERDLVYYLKEFAGDIELLKNIEDKPKRQVRSIVFNPKEFLESPHKHASYIDEKDFRFVFDLTGRARMDFNADRTIFRRAAGIGFYGEFASRVGYFFSFSDNVERGGGGYYSRDELLDDHYGYVGPLLGGKETYYDLTEAYLSASWKLVDVTFGKDRVAWGVADDPLLLSGMAPSFNHLRFNFKLGSKARFRFLVGKLYSLSAQSDTIYTTENDWHRVIPADKWITAHRVEYYFNENIIIAVSEALIWGDRGFDAAYLNPLNFLFSAEHDGGDLDNVLMAGDLIVRFSRSNIFYASLLLDDLKISNIGKKGISNKFGTTAGVKLNDLRINGLSGGLEYTRIQPFVYSHFFPVNRYTTWSTSLGSGLDPNSDRFRVQIRYKPVFNLTLKLRLDYNRHGSVGGAVEETVRRGSNEEVYFLAGKSNSWREIESSIEWEFLTAAILKIGRITGDETSVISDRYFFGIGYRY